MAQVWDSAEYAAHGRFVADLGSPVVDLLAPRTGERILDVGCGDGALTARLAATGAAVTGADPSQGMVEAAARLAAASGGKFSVVRSTAEALPFHEEFDAVFSNAALHWIPEERQTLALRKIHETLRPGGRFVAEMGGQGNIAAIRTALRAVLGGFGVDAEAQAASFYPSPARYRGMLEAAGFAVETIELIPRPTPLPDGAEGMVLWLTTFRSGLLESLAEDDRRTAVERTVEMLRPILMGAEDGWTADYVRLRFRAVRG